MPYLSEELDVRKVTKLLEEIGWKPFTVKERIAFFISKKSWNELVAIGSSAIEPLIYRLYAPHKYQEALNDRLDSRYVWTGCLDYFLREKYRKQSDVVNVLFELLSSTPTETLLQYLDRTDLADSFRVRLLELAVKREGRNLMPNMIHFLKILPHGAVRYKIAEVLREWGLVSLHDKSESLKLLPGELPVKLKKSKSLLEIDSGSLLRLPQVEGGQFFVKAEIVEDRLSDRTGFQERSLYLKLLYAELHTPV